MLPDDINKRVLKYVNKDKTNLALMLDGVWGSGKSYYIKNNLSKYLSENGIKNCIVSIYGLKEIEDVSKAIFFELKYNYIKNHGIIKRIGNTKIIDSIKGRKIFKKTKNGIMGGAPVIAKTLVSGVAKSKGIELKITSRDVSRIYSSVDVSNTLLIIEDVERSRIDISELLGFFNGLVENDNAKVLLVVNENQLLDKRIEETDPFLMGFEDKKQESEEKSDRVKKYINYKEKTVGDTIQFTADYREVAANIIQEYNNPSLIKFLDDDGIKEISDLIEFYSRKNIRSFIYAIQKTVEIIDFLDDAKKEDEIFVKKIFFSNVIFAAKIKAEEFPEWKSFYYANSELGNTKYPVFRFCYEYFRWNKTSEEQIDKDYDLYKSLMMNDQNLDEGDEELWTLYNYLWQEEDKLVETIDSIKKRIRAKDIHYHQYSKIVFYLIKIESIFSENYSEIIDNMVENIKNEPQITIEECIEVSLNKFDSTDQEQKYKTIIGRFKDAANYREYAFEFSYNPKDVEKMVGELEKEKHFIDEYHSFIKNLNVDELCKMVFSSTSRQLHSLRNIFVGIYQRANTHNCEKEDVELLKEFKEQIEIEKEKREISDRIINKQLELLISGIEFCIERATN